MPVEKGGVCVKRPHECIVREGRNPRVISGAGRALLQPGRALDALTSPVKGDGGAAGNRSDMSNKQRGSRASSIEVGVQTTNEVHSTAAGATSSCLLCGRQAECSMADLNDSDKGQIAAVLKQVLELSELNDSMTGQLEAGKTEHQEATDKAAALAGEVDGLRGKLSQALDLLRAYQKRVREMQQALVASDQALIALRSEHKALLVRIPGARVAPPTPPQRVNSCSEQVSGDLSAAVDSIAAALETDPDMVRTPRESTHDATGFGQESSAPGTQENTPAPQRPAPTPHLPDESSSSLHHRIADIKPTSPGVQPALSNVAEWSAVRSQASEQEQAVALTNGMPGRRNGEPECRSTPQAAAQLTPDLPLDPGLKPSSSRGELAVQAGVAPTGGVNPQRDDLADRKAHPKLSLEMETTGQQQSSPGRAEPAIADVACHSESSGDLASRGAEGVPTVAAAAHEGLPAESGASRRCLAFEDGNAAAALQKDAGRYVAAVCVDISSSSSSSEDEGGGHATCQNPSIKVVEPKLVSFAPQERAAAESPAPESRPACGSESADIHAIKVSSEEEAAGRSSWAEGTQPAAQPPLNELPAPELELLSMLVENALSTSRDKSISPGKASARTHSRDRVATRSPSKTRLGRTRRKNLPGTLPSGHDSSTSPARQGSQAVRVDAPKRGRGRGPSPSKRERASPSRRKERLLQTRIRTGGRSPSKAQEVASGGGGSETGGGNSTLEALLAPPQQEKLNGAEEFYDDSLFRLVDMLDEVRDLRHPERLTPCPGPACLTSFHGRTDIQRSRGVGGWGG